MTMKRIDGTFIYENSPLLIQNMMVSIKGYLQKRQRYSELYYQALKEYKSIDAKNFSAIKMYQEARIKEIILHAYANSPFYNKFYRNINLEKINSVEDLKLLPILEKETFRSNIDSIYTIQHKDSIISNTSGTTGKSLTVYYTKRDFQRRMAFLDSFKEQHGFVNLKMKRASFGGKRIIPERQSSNVYWRDNIFIKQRLYSGRHCQGKNLTYYIDNLNEYKPDSLDGYPSSLYLLARYIVDNNIKLTFKPIAIFPTAETLLPHYKQTIEQAFGCNVYDQYASSEGAPFITECAYRKLHYCMQTGVIETDHENNMIVTSFETQGTPLIRYNIGDQIEFARNDEKCECGSVMPIVSRIKGRSHDYLVGRNGVKQPMQYFSLASDQYANSIKQAQFIQNTIGIVDVLLVVDEKKFDESMIGILVNKLQYTLGFDTKVNVRIVDDIEKDKSGKTRIIINNLECSDVL